MDFQFDNQCIQILLRMVSHGNAVIAELFRLSTCVPAEYKPAVNRADEKNHAHIISDFSYFKQAEVFEKRIESSDRLKQLDEQLRENDIGILARFYRVFESIHRYAMELNRFASDVDDGAYIQQSFDSLLQSDEGKQLLTEAYFLYGVMLLAAELKYPGVVRERLLVAYYRYTAQQMSSESTIDDICRLFRSTGFTPGHTKKPPKYLDEYLNRVPVNERHVKLIIARLRSDDIYHRTETFPLPEHRNHALASQASMLFVLLHFCPQILHNDAAMMREIVDKFFSESWLLSVYLGISCNLVEVWEPYKAAKTAITSALSNENVRMLSLRHAESLRQCMPTLLDYLKDENLNEDATSQLDKILILARRTNVTIRWFMLHTVPLDTQAEANKRCRALRDQVIRDAEFTTGKLLELLLRCAEFELNLKETVRQLLEQKEDKWLRCQRDCVERLRELADAFSGSKSLTRIARNEKLQQWFMQMATQVETSLQFNDSKRTGRKIIRLYQALQQVQSFHELDTQLHVRQFLEETRQLLLYMEKLFRVDEQLLINLQTIGDLSYAWPLIDTYTRQMQDGVKRRPNLVHKLRAAFLKLSSALDSPLVRINQANSPDLVSVSQYYSSELVAYVRNVLQIIPHSMFMLLNRIVDLETNHIKELPTRIERDKLKDYAQLDERFEVAQLTYKISTFTQGILKMKTTLVGIIKIDPAQLLEDGIRKELVQLVAHALHSSLVFHDKHHRSSSSSSSSSANFIDKLTELERKMDGLRRSFEYVQDYVGICGLKLWHEETSRLMNFNVEQECNAYANSSTPRVHAWDSVYQSTEIPLPQYEPLDELSLTFVGRLARELLRITDPHLTLFAENTQTWYIPSGNTTTPSHHVLHEKVFTKIHSVLGTPGFVGFDRLLSFMLTAELEQLFQTMRRVVVENDAGLREFISDHARYVENVLAVGILPTNTNQNQPDHGASVILIEFARQCQVYQKRVGGSGSAATSVVHSSGMNAITATSGGPWSAVVDGLLRIGQLQVLRGCIAHELRVSSSFDAKLLCDAVRNANEAVLLDIASGDMRGSSSGAAAAQDDAGEAKPVRMQESSPLLASLTKLLDSLGFAEPMQKIYVDVNSLSRSGFTHRVQQQVPALLFLFIVSQLNKLHAGSTTTSLLLVNTARASAAGGEAYDAMVFIYGLVTLLRHVHVECIKSVVATLGRYVQAQLCTSKYHATGGVPDESGWNNNVAAVNNPVGQETFRIASQRDGAALVRVLQCLKRFDVIDEDMFEALIGNQLASLHAPATVTSKNG